MPRACRGAPLEPPSRGHRHLFKQPDASYPRSGIRGRRTMRIGGAMFFTDYSMSPTELARALEDRGFDSLWVPEHSRIPLTRKSPFPSGGDLPKKYYDVMDPFV